MFEHVYKNKLTNKEMGKVLKHIDGEKRLKEVGEGCSAVVYSLNRDMVMRVECVYTHSRYNEYVTKVVLKNKSKYLPKIFFHGIREVGFHREIITVMEKLKQDEHHPVIQAIEDKYCWEKKKVKLPSKVKSAINRLSRNAKKEGLEFNDLHTGNILLRGDGQIVITDPCS